MLDRLDRIQLAVPDLDAAAAIWDEIFDTTGSEDDEVPHLSAKRRTLRLPESDVELLCPDGVGPVQDFVARWKTGLFGFGFSTSKATEILARAKDAGWPTHVAGDQLFVGPTEPGGLRVVLTSERSFAGREQAALIRHVYEVTNPVDDLKAATDAYAKVFGMDASKFQPLYNSFYKYDGTLTLIHPPTLLDRIEVTKTFDNETAAMGRFYEKRGESLYMCFAETDRFDDMVARLESLDAQFAMRDPNDMSGEQNVLFIHPKSLCGMLMGISATGVAWEWSRGLRH